MIPKKVFSDNLRLFSRFSKNKVPFVENSSPDISIEEARADVAPFLETNRTTVAIFGLKIPYFLALEPWIQQSAGHQLVFLEDDLEVFSAFLTKEEASSLLAHPQVSIALLSQSDDENAPSLSRLSNDFYFFSAKSHLSRSGPVYAKLLQDVYAIRAYLAKIVLYKNDAHFYRHLAALNEGSFFKESMPQVPFVICGAGPSLQEDMDELKGLMVLASGTAMNILNDAGIQADLGVAFDFHPAAMRRLSANNAFLTPFFVDLDSSFEGARYLHGRKFLTLTDPASWKWNMLKAFKVEDAIIKLPASITSTHYALNAALRLKSPAQMLLGVDLAYLKGRQYAGRKTWISDEDDPTPLSQRTDLIEIKDALMSRTYQAEAAIFAHMVREHPEIQYFYGSKLSRGINGIPYLSLQEWKKRYPGGFNEVFLAAIEKQPLMQVDLNLILSVLKQWREELEALNQKDLAVLERHPIFEDYVKRLSLKYALDFRWLKLKEDQEGLLKLETSIRLFLLEVLDLHLKRLNEAIWDVEERIAFPKKGLKQAKIPTLNGEIEGTVELYYDNGQLKTRVEFHEGKRHGKFQFYSRSGVLLEEGTFINGMPQGEYKEWDRKGMLKKKLTAYPDGTFDLTEWNDKGEMIQTVKSAGIDEELFRLKESFKEFF